MDLGGDGILMKQPRRTEYNQPIVSALPTDVLDNFLVNTLQDFYVFFCHEQYPEKEG